MRAPWSATAPLRVDFAGGTLDLWPLYLLQPGSSTVNVAIRVMATAEYCPGGDRWDLRAGDHGVRRRVSVGRVDTAWRKVPRGDPFALVLRVLSHIGPLEPGRLTTAIQGPSGAGIGGSSALLIALYSLLSRVAGRRLERDRTVPVARDLEASILGFPTGVQDYHPALHGGVLRLAFGPGGTTVERLAADIPELERRTVLAYSGRPHASAPTNWVLFRRRVEGDARAVESFGQIAEASVQAAEALGTSNWRRLGAAMDLDWDARKRLEPRLAPTDLRRLERAARAAGVAGGKCCGAASGGCMLFLLRRPEDRDQVEAALTQAGATLLPFRVARQGVRVSRPSS